MKKCREEVRLALQSIGEAACRTETQTKIPLKVINEAREVLLASLVVDKLKELGFSVYCYESGYYVKWGKDSRNKEVKQ